MHRIRFRHLLRVTTELAEVASTNIFFQVNIHFDMRHKKMLYFNARSCDYIHFVLRVRASSGPEVREPSSAYGRSLWVFPRDLRILLIFAHYRLDMRRS